MVTSAQLLCLSVVPLIAMRLPLNGTVKVFLWGRIHHDTPMALPESGTSSTCCRYAPTKSCGSTSSSTSRLSSAWQGFRLRLSVHSSDRSSPFWSYQLTPLTMPFCCWAMVSNGEISKSNPNRFFFIVVCSCYDMQLLTLCRLQRRHFCRTLWILDKKTVPLHKNISKAYNHHE